MDSSILVDFLDEAEQRSARGGEALRTLVRERTLEERIALLKAAVAELPRLRAMEDGEILYATVDMLYRSRLPMTTEDLRDLLLAARHDCGHGVDTRPPFDLARTHMRTYGYAPELGAAIAAFIENLPRSSAIHIKELRRSAALVAVLGTTPVGHKDSWIRRFQVNLAALDRTELTVWQNLIVAMSVQERMVMPNTWRAPAERAIEALGADRIVQRLRQWWPEGDEDGVVNLQDGGTQIVKHFIWLLSILGSPDGDPLVIRLATLRFKGRDAPMAVLKPAAGYLEDATGREAQLARAQLLARIAAAGS